jgi:hypothetical protein
MLNARDSDGDEAASVSRQKDAAPYGAGYAALLKTVIITVLLSKLEYCKLKR